MTNIVQPITILIPIYRFYQANPNGLNTKTSPRLPSPHPPPHAVFPRLQSSSLHHCRCQNQPVNSPALTVYQVLAAPNEPAPLESFWFDFDAPVPDVDFLRGMRAFRFSKEEARTGLVQTSKYLAERLVYASRTLVRTWWNRLAILWMHVWIVVRLGELPDMGILLWWVVLKDGYVRFGLWRERQ